MILFETPGLLDFRSFTVMGLSAKPNSASPIGRFGTGLKYAAAVVTRLGGTMIVFIGRDKYSFSEKRDEFRGKEFTLLQLKRERWSVDRMLKGHFIPLPFTTEYGKFWEPWMAFRELEANTRDEGGTTRRVDLKVYGDARDAAILYEQPIYDRPSGRDGYTRIFVDLPGIDEAYDRCAEIFLPGANGASTGVQVLERSSKYLYWRGLRVHQPLKPTRFTYNFGQPLSLTEDRTLAFQFEASSALAENLATVADEATIESVLTAGDKFWESDLDFDGLSLPPSEAFRRVMARYPKNANRRALGYYSRWVEAPATRRQSLLERHPAPWKVSERDVSDATGAPVFEAPYGYMGFWRTTAEELCRKLDVLEDPSKPATESAPVRGPDIVASDPPSKMEWWPEEIPF